jgi:enoyl-CoA hydratase
MTDAKTLVLREDRDGIAVITLNRPEAMNALSRALQTQLAETIAAAATDEAIRVIVLTGAGQRAFSAGLDLKEVAAHGLARGASSEPMADPVAALAACTKPIVGAINGVAVTGGFELALACDILIASESARFADTHARVGVIPGWGLSQKLSRTIGLSRAKSLSFTGDYIDAATAAAWGLVTKVVAADALMPEAMRTAAAIAALEPVMIARYKALIDEGFALPYREAMALEAERTKAQNRDFSPAAFAERREAIQARGRAQTK